jgi:hypothetical protein
LSDLPTPISDKKKLMKQRSFEVGQGEEAKDRISLKATSISNLGNDERSLKWLGVN